MSAQEAAGDAEDGEMSSRDDQATSTASLAPNFHPEFGYLCPSAAFWRRLRVAAKLVLAGMAVAAGAAFGLSSVLLPPLDQGKRAMPAAIAQVSQGAQGSQASQASPSAPAQTTAPATAPAVTPDAAAALARAQASCDDPSVSFLSPQCQLVRKSRALRAAQEKRRRLASVPLGHVGAPAASDTTPAPTAAVVRQAPPAPDKPKRPVRFAHKHRPSYSDIETAEVAPPPPPPGFGLFGFFRGF
jgi:hypothetical protein